MSYDVKAVRAAARGRWATILRDFGVGESFLKDSHGPCPACGGNDRFRFDDKNGDGDWYCNQCGGADAQGGAGDGLMLVERLTGLPFNEVVDEVGKWLYIPESEGQRPRIETVEKNIKPKQDEKWKPVTPVPDSAPALFSGDWATVWNPKKEGSGMPGEKPYSGSKVKPKLVTEIRDIDGNLYGYVFRLEFKPGEKITPQITYCVNTETGEERWCMKGLPTGRPVIGAHLLKGRPAGSPVLLVEGEKAREAGLRLMGSRMPVVTWVGGSKAIDLTDWSSLAGLKVIAWPDADDDGLKAVRGLDFDGKLTPGIADMALEAGAAGFRFVTPPVEHLLKQDGWDLADAEAEGWDFARVNEHIKANLQEPAPLVKTSRPPLPAPAPVTPANVSEEVDGGAIDETPSGEGGILDHVRPMGHNRGAFYYWSASLGQIVALSASKHTKTGLLSIAQASVWKAFFDKPKSPDFDLDNAVDWLFEACRLKGVYDPRRVRGRGAWLDNGRTVIHLGDRLIVDGQKTGLAKIRSVYAYEQAYSIPGPAEDEITPGEIIRLTNLAKRIRWEVEASAYLLLGWIVLAPLSGSLEQRPTIWITGGSGSGKSTVVQKFLNPLLGEMSHYFMGAGTTEPGVRQELNGDAIPVVIDEFEQIEKRHHDRVQGILELARGSYSDDGAKTAKGSAGGLAQIYTVRSMFAFASISVGIKERADANRISILSLRTPNPHQTDEEKAAGSKEWDLFKAELEAFITKDLSRRILARTVRRLPIVRENIRVFVRAAARVLDSQRLADTYGVMLGGAWSLLHDEPATAERADDMIRGMNWEAYTELAEENEADAALSTILQITMIVDGADQRSSLSIGDLIKICAKGHGLKGIYQEDARITLAHFGIRVDGDKLYIANTSRKLAAALADTAYSVNWKNYLRRIKGAESEPAKKFGTGITARCTSLPLGPIIED